MPLVSAADYPVQRGPTTSPAAPEALRGDYQNLPAATPEAFGATVGAAQQQLGRSFEQAGDVLKNAAVTRQDFLNKTATDKAVNDYYDRTIALSYGDPNTPNDTGFMGKQGQDAVAQMPDFRNSLDSERNRIRATLTNPLQQLNFDNETRRQQAITLARAGEHFDRQLRADAAATSQAKEANAYRSLTTATAANDDLTHNESIKVAMNAAIAAETALHGTPSADTITKILGNVRENAVLAKVEGLRPTDPAAALQLLQNNRDAIPDTAKYAAKYHELYTASVAQRAQEANYGVPAGQKPTSSFPGGTSKVSDPRGLVPFIRETAQKYGHDPDTVVAAAQAEGLSTPIGDNGTSFGAFQLHVGGGLGDEFKQETGLDPADPKNEKATIEWAIKNLNRTGWDPYHGVRGLEYSSREGLNVKPPGAAPPAGGIIDKTQEAGFGNKFGILDHPQGMIIHHTAGGESVDDVISTFKKTGFPAQFVIDRQGKIYQTLPDGYQGRHIRNSYGPLGEGKTNQNMEGVEIIANNDGDVRPVQQEAAARLVAMRAAKFGYDPKTSVFGHGEVNPGHKQADEGMSTVTRIRNGSLSTAAPTVTAPPTTTATAPAAPPDTVQPAGAAPPLMPVSAVVPGAVAEPAAVVGSDGIVRPMPAHGDNETLDTQVPGLPERIQHLAETLPPPNTKENRDVWNAAVALARKDMNMAYANQQHAYRISQEANQQEVRNAENEIWKDVYSQNPKLTPSQVAIDPRFNSNPERRKQMIELINNPPGIAVPAAQSYNAAQALIDRIRLPTGTEGKITTRDQIYDQMRTLNRADLEFVLKKYDELSSPGEHRFSARLEEFFKGVTPQIDKSGALPLLPNDAIGKAKSYEFRRYVEDKADQYRAAGKDPDALLNPKSSDYVGTPEVLKPYKRTLTQALADFQTENEGPLGATQEDLSTPDKLKAAVKDGKITREQAEAEALRKGWIRPAPVPPPANLAPPVAQP